jgi:hypothetical protein
MQPVGCERYGSDNTIWVARIVWDRPNLPITDIVRTTCH